MSERTLEFHHGKHHKSYIDRTNRFIQGTPLEKLPIVDIIRSTAKDTSKRPIFDAAAQAWNHGFFWQSMTPGGGDQPTGEVLQAIDRCFGGCAKFRDEFKSACVGQFGSGWGWMVLDGDQVEVVSTQNAANPMSQGSVALLACDVWEHAYYLDFQNRRADFVDTFLDHLVNWNHVAMHLKTRADWAA